MASAFRDKDLPFALGGALAMNRYCTERFTRDVDMNVFVEATRIDDVIACLQLSGATFDSAQVRRQAQQSEALVARFGDIRVDIFLNTIPLHVDAQSRVVVHPADKWKIPYLSLEDLIVLKTFFDRIKDRHDIEVAAMEVGESLDVAYIRHQLLAHLDESDPAVVRTLRTLSAPGTSRD